MIYPHEQKETITFLTSLKDTTGGYTDTPFAPAALQPTLSVCKALKYFGIAPQNPDDIFNFVTNCFDSATGAYIDTSSTRPTVFATAIGLLLLHSIGATEALTKQYPAAMQFMSRNATIREEHFMVIAVIDECKLDIPVPASTIAFLRAMQEENGTFGKSVLNNAIIASALIRAKESLKNPQAVAQLLLSGQQQDGGFADKEGASELGTSYGVMRTLDL